MAGDVPIEQLLADLGLTGAAATVARVVLENEGLTNARKQRIAVSKVALVTASLDRHWQRLCHNCVRRAVADGLPVVEVPSAACSMCGGSNNARAVGAMTEACRAAGIKRLVVVGGSPSTRRELMETVGDALELRPDIAWADLVVVLGSTQLAHRVSNLYTRDPVARKKLVTTNRRGIEAIADDVTRSDIVGGARR
jgi:hypothetical protein